MAFDVAIVKNPLLANGVATVLAENGWMPGCEYLPFSFIQEELNDEVAQGNMYAGAIVNHVLSGYVGGVRGMVTPQYTAAYNKDKVDWHFTVGRLGEKLQHRSIWSPARH